MAGTLEGGMKAALKNKERYDEKYQKRYGMGFYEYIGSIGGKNGHTGGFASKVLCDCAYKDDLHKKAECAGALGGKISKRGKAE